jgi:D-alanyl-D-alanine carboxypeptidase
MLRWPTLRWIACLVLVAAASAHAQQVIIPDTPAGRALSAWLEAFNSGERDRIAAYQQQYGVSGPPPDAVVSFRTQTGGFDLVSIDKSEPLHIEFVAKERASDTRAEGALDITDSSPPKVRGPMLRAMRPAATEVPRMSEPEIIAGLRTELDKDSAADRFAGAVLVTKQGKTLFSGAYGLADREKKVPNTLDTVFRIGSMNKMFTGTAVLQLVHAGKIKLTDPLGKYLTDYPNKDVATKVTIHHLLAHTGGTGDIFGPEFASRRLELRTLNDYVALYGKRDLLFEPGSRWEYSNYGMLLLGVVIERVTGQTYYDYVAQKIFKPAGMTRSNSEPESTSVRGRSVGYTRMPGNAEWTPNTDTLPFRGTPAGGGYSTVGDLVRFAEALLSHKLLDPEHTKLLITGKVESRGGGQYAYGFEDLRKPGGAGFVGHGGGAPGMNGMLRIYPSSGYVVAVLSNLDPPAAVRISQYLEVRLEK